MGKYATVGDRFLAFVIGMLLGCMLFTAGCRIWNYYADKKVDTVHQAAVQQLKNRLLFTIADQRHELEGIKAGNYQRVEIPSKTPAEMKTALTVLNKAIATHEAATAEYKKRYLRMLTELERAVRQEEDVNTAP